MVDNVTRPVYQMAREEDKLEVSAIFDTGGHAPSPSTGANGRDGARPSPFPPRLRVRQKIGYTIRG